MVKKVLVLSLFLLGSLNGLAHADSSDVLLAARPKSTLHENSSASNRREALRQSRLEHRVMPFAFVPGWEQWRRGQKTKAFVVIGGFVTCVAATAYFSNAGDSDYATWKNSPTDSLKSQVQQDDILFSTFACATVAFYAYNILDAFVLGKPKDRSPASLTQPYLPQVGMTILPHRPAMLTLGWQI